MKALHCIAGNIALVLLLVLAGCEAINAPPPASAFFVARLQDCKPGATIPSCENFVAGEEPAVVCVNYQRQTVTVRVNNVTTGAISWNRTEYIPQDRTTCWWSLKVLPAGTYKAEVFTGGTFLRSYTFNIARPAPRKR
jgi:hypothetical protein